MNPNENLICLYRSAQRQSVRWTQVRVLLGTLLPLSFVCCATGPALMQVIWDEREPFVLVLIVLFLWVLIVWALPDTSRWLVAMSDVTLRDDGLVLELMPGVRHFVPVAELRHLEIHRREGETFAIYGFPRVVYEERPYHIAYIPGRHLSPIHLVAGLSCGLKFNSVFIITPHHDNSAELLRRLDELRRDTD